MKLSRALLLSVGLFWHTRMCQKRPRTDLWRSKRAEKLYWHWLATEPY
jgi:hypothetical protein